MRTTNVYTGCHDRVCDVCGEKHWNGVETIEVSYGYGHPVYDGIVIDLCSDGCLLKYAQDPERYINKKNNGEAT